MAGAAVGLPLPFMKGGAWDVHGGIDVLFLGKTLEALNGGRNIRPVLMVGGGAAF